jgi:hypothetical protein
MKNIVESKDKNWWIKDSLHIYGLNLDNKYIIVKINFDIEYAASEFIVL